MEKKEGPMLYLLLLTLFTIFRKMNRCILIKNSYIGGCDLHNQLKDRKLYKTQLKFFVTMSPVNSKTLQTKNSSQPIKVYFHKLSFKESKDILSK